MHSSLAVKLIVSQIYTVEFSLARYSSIAVYANNSVIDINLVGEGFEEPKITDGGALECHTDDTTCCRGIDNPNGPGRGEWYYPNGTIVPSPGNSMIYRTRDHMVIRLNRVGASDGGTVGTPGLYKCEIPGVGGSIVRTITLIHSESKVRYVLLINYLLLSLFQMLFVMTYLKLTI